MLAFEDLLELFPERKGVHETSIVFHAVSADSASSQHKGLFFPMAPGADLLEAIGNGAIAAVWQKDWTVPAYTPNHFPVFFTDDSAAAMALLLESYLTKIYREKCGEMITNMIDLTDLQRKQNDKQAPYALIEVRAREIMNAASGLSKNRGGSE